MEEEYYKFIDRIGRLGFKDLWDLGFLDSCFFSSFSQARAETVADYLALKLGLDREAIIAEGRADAEPIASNATREGRDLNDRVTMEISGRRK